MPETVNLKDAMKLVKKPRTGDAVMPFKKPKFNANDGMASVDDDTASERGTATALSEAY